MPIEGKTTYEQLIAICSEYNASLLAVSKTRPEKEILALYKKGQRIFGENRAHELIIKAAMLPNDISWHLIGHLQTNKVKSVIRFVDCIQSLDSLKLWHKIDEAAKEEGIRVNCLLQIKIAQEESKYGWDFDDLQKAFESSILVTLPSVHITGVMGMASLTSDQEQVRKEFSTLKDYFNVLKEKYFKNDPSFSTISMGMSGDYKIALEEGSTMLRIGSLLFNE